MIHRFQQRNRGLPKQKQRDCPHIICNGGVQAYLWRLLVTEIDGCGRMIKNRGAAEAQQELLVSAITWFLISLGCFYGVSVLMGIAWLCVAIVQLIVAFVSKGKKE